MSAQRLVTRERGAAPRDTGRFLGRSDSLTAKEADLLRRARDAFEQAAHESWSHDALAREPRPVEAQGRANGGVDFPPHVSRFVGPRDRDRDQPTIHDDPPVVIPSDDEPDELLDWLADQSSFAVVDHEPASIATLPPSLFSTKPGRGAERSTSGDTLLESLACAEDPVGVFAWPGGRVEWANDALAARAQSDQSSWSFMSLLDEWSQAHFLARVLPTLLSDRRWRGLLRFTESSGDETWMASTVIAHHDAKDQIDALVVLAHEVVPTPLLVNLR